VFKRLAHALILFALLCAIGAHWAVLQSVAWTTMLAQSLRTNSISQAVERTFDGEHPCALCKKIAKSKQQERKSVFPSEFKKFEFSFSRSAFKFTAPFRFYEVRNLDDAFNGFSLPPPVPPPKGFLG
jgi:hypothetical protein